MNISWQHVPQVTRHVMYLGTHYIGTTHGGKHIVQFNPHLPGYIGHVHFHMRVTVRKSIRMLVRTNRMQLTGRQLQLQVTTHPLHTLFSRFLRSMQHVVGVHTNARAHVSF